MTELDAKRLLVARMITAENDYDAVSLEYWSAFKREYNYNVPIPAYRIQHHIIRADKAAWYKREFARKDVKAFQG